MSNNDQLEDRDDYVVQSIVSKFEERKLIQTQQFEAVCAKFWQLMTQSASSNNSSETLSKNQFTDLHMRILKVLAPLYRESEMVKEVANDWLLDSNGHSEMTLNLFQKYLFRIAHQWAVSFDLAEYCDLLQQIFDRVTARKIVRSNGTVQLVLPQIQVQISQVRPNEDEEEEEEEVAEAEGEEEEEVHAWEEIESDEEEENGYEYEVRDGIRCKREQARQKVASENEQVEKKLEIAPKAVKEVFFIARDPFTYTETAVYYHPDATGKYVPAPTNEEFEYSVLSEFNDVYPMGYPTEQFLCWIKNDVYKAFLKIKEDKKQAVAAMKQQLFEGGAGGQGTQVVDRDPGLLKEEHKSVDLFFTLFSSTNVVNTTTYANITDNAYNSLRTMFKESTQLVLRPKIFKVKSSSNNRRAKVDLNQPVSIKTQFGYNPTLERRVNFKLTVDLNANKTFVNVNYLVVDPVFETAYRCDVKRIETSDKMAIKPEDEFKRDEEFCNVTTSFALAKQIMLSRKFETFFTIKLQGDTEKGVERDNMVLNSERARMKQARSRESIVAKLMEETFDEVPFMKNIGGPFYQLLSESGPQHDDFYRMGRHDLIQTANKERLRVLLLGKPRSGKTTLAKELEKSLNLVRVSTDTWIANLFKKIKDREENPPEEEPEPELEEGQERPPKKSWMEPLDEQVYNKLREGGAPDQVEVWEMLRQLVNSPAALTRGFVLDLDFTAEDRLSQKERVLKCELLNGQDFTHIVQIEIEHDEVRERAANLRANIADGIVYSRTEREERKKPKKVLAEDEEPPEEDEENVIKPFVENDLAIRECDNADNISALLENYCNVEQPDFDEFIATRSNSTYLKILADGLTVEELTQALVYKIKSNASEPLTPVAIIIEGGSDFKGLLTEGIDPEDGTLPRRWSLWKTVDPVALRAGQVTFGVPEFACHYANNVFVFKDDINLKVFVANPRLYLSQSPKMPSDYRVMMVGPRGSGYHTQAKLLSERYGWRIVDFPRIVEEKLADLVSMTVKLPNNVSEKGPCKICMSEQELNEIKEGKIFPAWKFLPWVMEYLGVPLQEKPPTPPEEVIEPDVTQMTDDEKKAFDKEQKKKTEEKKKKDKEEEELRKAKADRHARRQEAREAGLDLEEMGLQDTEEEIKIPDLSLDQLIPRLDENGNKPVIGKFILIGFPRSEIQISKMKDYGINLDRVIYLNDTSEEPGVEIKKRVAANSKNNDVAFDWEKENESIGKVIATVKEGCGEELVKEINCIGSVEEVKIKILTEIDPFFLLPDNTDENRTTELDVNIDDEAPENTRWLPKSDFGDYCPVSYVKHGFLVKGNKEFESTIQGKTYWFAGEAEQNEFKFNPNKFLVGIQLPLAPPAPKIMIIGQKGSGTSTQIAKLCAKYKISNLELANSYLATMRADKELRKRARLLARGFRPPLPVEEEGAMPEPDPEIEDDPEDFDRAANEKLVMQKVLKAQGGLVIDGVWTSLPDDTVSVPLHELLFESRRTPEVVVVLRCKEESTFKRCIDEQKIKAKYDQIVKERKEAKDKQRAEDKKTKRGELLDENKQDPEAEDKKSDEQVLAIVEAALADWERTRIEEDIQAEEDDPDKPVLADMMDAEKEKLRELREKDETMLNEFVEYMTEKKVRVIDKIQTEVSADYVHIKIVEQLKERMLTREDLIEREQCMNLRPSEVKNYEKSYTYKHSKFGLSSPITPSNPEKTKEFSVLYRERIYFLANEEERTKFKLTPSKFTLNVEPVPLDVDVKPAVCVIGLPKSGKSVLCQTLSRRTKVVHLEPESIIDFFIKRDCNFAKALRNRMFLYGKDVEDQVMMDLIKRRIQMRDCQENGWVMEGYPKTREQAKEFVLKVQKPSNVIYLQVPFSEVYKRTQATVASDFASDRTILVRHLNFLSKHIPHVALFFQKYYNSLTSIDSLKSCWFMEDRALEAIEKTVSARLAFARDNFFKQSKNGENRCCVMENMNYDRCYVKKALSQYSYICPVSWKQSKKFINCCHRPEYTVLYQNQFYYFAGPNERAIFIANPSVFTEKIVLSTARNIPSLLRQHKASEIIAQEKALMGHCSVTLKDEERVLKGENLILVNFKDQRYVFETQEKAIKFMCDPSRYSGVQLPVKMPASKDSVSLFSLQRKETSITFMEQALSSVVTRGLREVGENRLKYPTLSCKETMLKLFAIFLKAENPANTDHMRDKYRQKMQEFIFKCEVPSELYELSQDKQEKLKKDRAWPEFKEDYYNKLGAKYDQIMSEVSKERATGFSFYIK